MSLGLLSLSSGAPERLDPSLTWFIASIQLTDSTASPPREPPVTPSITPLSVPSDLESVMDKISWTALHVNEHRQSHEQPSIKASQQLDRLSGHPVGKFSQYNSSRR